MIRNLLYKDQVIVSIKVWNLGSKRNLSMIRYIIKEDKFWTILRICYRIMYGIFRS